MSRDKASIMETAKIVNIMFVVNQYYDNGSDDVGAGIVKNSDSFKYWMINQLE